MNHTKKRGQERKGVLLVLKVSDDSLFVSTTLQAAVSTSSLKDALAMFLD